ncbi:hypothetical protein [Paenibacillus sedimenti]|uniref:Uncharacterized protein n=1 Tax=Paenibacillus sedimenti TaxID=2770274 RepID=A0A926QKA0_9BACL|nr:hypothetical protein [Paenibacillus sedimenti]MBD0381267.1 hypothetical protein [Paenibacillus sedimenti]
MIEGIPHELLAVFGMGVIGFVGSTVLLELKQPNMIIGWNIILSLAAAVVTLKYVWDKTRAIGAIFHVFF